MSHRHFAGGFFILQFSGKQIFSEMIDQRAGKPEFDEASQANVEIVNGFKPIKIKNKIKKKIKNKIKIEIKNKIKIEIKIKKEKKKIN